MLTPGAARSGLSVTLPSKSIVGPRELKDANVSPALAETSATFTLPGASCDFSCAPAAFEMPTAGIVIVESATPPMSSGGAASTLFATMTALAPLVCAFNTLTVKLHVPRSIRTILPATLPANVDSHASVGGPTPSLASTTCPDWPDGGGGRVVSGVT